MKIGIIGNGFIGKAMQVIRNDIVEILYFRCNYRQKYE